MYRLLLLVFALSLMAVPAQAQSTTSTRPAMRPLTPMPVARPASNALSDLLAERDAAAADSLSEPEVLRRISRLYRYQSEILDAQAEEDTELAENLLVLAMTEMTTLLHQPGIMERPRFRELYRTLVTEYERFYGVAADTLTIQYGDIFQFRADMFAALNDVNEPLLENVVLPRLQPAETVFPMTMNRLVESSITYLLRSPERHLLNWLSRAETYFPMIEQIFEEEGVPDELKYLAMIESGLNPRARSWAQAAGMWQFITATGRAYDLDVNPWVDERLDPEKATRAAARHLRDLYDHFDGDWQLALAGYNCSPSRIKRAMARAEQRLGRRATFWDIYDDIPRETRNYVPMFIAASLVASNPDAFNVPGVDPGPRYAYHYVPVHGMLALGDVAGLAGTSEDMIRALNPELRGGMLPPSNGPYFVRIPLGSLDAFQRAYAALPPERTAPVTEHIVRRGDSLGKIAKRYNVSVSALQQASGLRSTTIHPGDRLVVPVPRAADIRPPVAIADADPVTVEYGQRKIRPIAVAEPATLPRHTPRPRSSLIVQASDTSTPEEAETEPEAPRTPPKAQPREPEPAVSETRIVYRVRRGDTLSEIARKYDVSIADLRRWNNLSGSSIQAGQQLSLYDTNPEAAPKAPTRTVYRVRRGDTLIEIAKRYGVSVDDLRRWNDISGSRIRTGQRLTIHHGGGSAASNDGAVTVYRVRRGDSLYTIARQHGVSVQDLKDWNSLKSDKIRPGQELTIRS